MRSVIERHGYSIDRAGFIHHDDRPSSYDAADEIAGRRLDRRRNYCIMDGKVHELVSFTQACSGCVPDEENVSHDRGGGCHECGYQGRVRQSYWMPLDISDSEAA